MKFYKGQKIKATRFATVHFSDRLNDDTIYIVEDIKDIVRIYVIVKGIQSSWHESYFVSVETVEDVLIRALKIT